MKLCLSVCILFHTVIGQKHLPNIVVVITDDQDYLMNGLDPMLKTKKMLGEKGTTFTNAFATTPLCCPSRASILTGLYQHNHHVLNNSLEGGCSSPEWQRTHEKNTFPVKLQNEGYNTFYAGKYLNQYGHKDAGGAEHVPPGWNKWIGLLGNSKYYNYTLSVDGKRKYFSNNYLTRVLRSYAISFLKAQNKTKPFLMIIAPPAPHQPFTPESRYEGYFKGKKVPRNVQFNFANNSNKHWLVRMQPSPLPQDLVNLLDTMYAKRWETLLSVDDLVESVLKNLKKLKLLKTTYLIFTSDNGYHLGQFSFAWDKRQMYEFDIRVPLMIRGPGVPKNVTVSEPVILPDIAPTVLSMGGLKVTSLDGKSFFPIRRTKQRLFLIEYNGEGRFHKAHSNCWPNDENVNQCSPEALCKCQDSINNTYTCLRLFNKVDDFIYCEFKDSEAFEEAYDLTKDPLQMDNIASKLGPRCKNLLSQILKKSKMCNGLKCSRLAYKVDCI